MQAVAKRPGWLPGQPAWSRRRAGVELASSLMERSGPVTIYDVAKYCGVSASTVSRAIAEPGMVRESTRSRILEAVESLGYRPSRLARGLSTGKTATIGVVVPDLTNPFFPGVLKGAQTVARASDFYVIVADTHVDLLGEADLIMTVAKQVDGVVVCSSRLADEELAELSRQMCMVCVNRWVSGVPAVLMESGGGVAKAAEHLAGLGHRKLAYVNGPARSWSNQERRAGLLGACRRLGLDVLELGPVVARYETGIALAEEVRASGATAVVGYNDLVSLGLMAGLAQLGLHVPDDMSVVGVDDIDMASMASPPLTTVRMPKEEAGQAAVELLLQALRPSVIPTPQTVQVDAQLILRATTGPVPS